jgi:hypothetical protein
MTKANSKATTKATKKDTKQVKGGHYTPPNASKQLPASYYMKAGKEEKKKGTPDY